jgi:Colicin V production protein
MYVDLLLLAIFFGTVASLAMAGIWTNFLTLVNVVTSALLAVNYFEPLAIYLQGLDGSYTYLLDFLSLWGIFGASMAILRAITDAISKVKVKFIKQVDLGVGIALACWVGWVLVCFTATTLHTAPLSRNYLGFQKMPETRLLFGLAPDHRWLGFVQKESQGALYRNVSVKHPDGAITKGNPFDPQGEYVFKYAERRARFEKEAGATVTATP